MLLDEIIDVCDICEQPIVRSWCWMLNTVGDRMDAHRANFDYIEGQPEADQTDHICPTGWR